MAALSQVMDAVNTSRRFVGAHEGTEDASSKLVGYVKGVHPLLVKCMQANISGFFTRKQIRSSLMKCRHVLFCFAFMHKQFRLPS